MARSLTNYPGQLEAYRLGHAIETYRFKAQLLYFVSNSDDGVVPQALGVDLADVLAAAESLSDKVTAPRTKRDLAELARLGKCLYDNLANHWNDSEHQKLIDFQNRSDSELLIGHWWPGSSPLEWSDWQKFRKLADRVERSILKSLKIWYALGRLVAQTGNLGKETEQDRLYGVRIPLAKLKRILRDSKLDVDVSSVGGALGAWELHDRILKHLSRLACNRRRMTQAEADIKAREYLRHHPNANVRKIAAGIGCSHGLVGKTSAYRAARAEKGIVRGPKVVSFTPKVEATHGQGVRHEVLEQLVTEQKTDYEPSPLEDDSSGRRRKVRQRKQI